MQGPSFQLPRPVQVMPRCVQIPPGVPHRFKVCQYSYSHFHKCHSMPHISQPWCISSGIFAQLWVEGTEWSQLEPKEICCQYCFSILNLQLTIAHRSKFSIIRSPTIPLFTVIQTSPNYKLFKTVDALNQVSHQTRPTCFHQCLSPTCSRRKTWETASGIGRGQSLLQPKVPRPPEWALSFVDTDPEPLKLYAGLSTGT